MHPTDGAPRGPSALTDDHPIQGLSESEGVQTVPNFMTDLEYDTQSNGWSDDLFEDYLEGVKDGDGERERWRSRNAQVCWHRSAQFCTWYFFWLSN